MFSYNSPKEVINQQDGRLIKLFFNNNSFITKGSIIGYLEANGDHNQIILLNKFLDSSSYDLIHNSPINITTRFKYNLKNLGDLQQEYQKFIISYQQFLDYIEGGYYTKKKHLLLTDIYNLKRVQKLLINDEALVNDDLTLAKESYLAFEVLLKDKIISKEEERMEMSKLLNKKLNLSEIYKISLNNQIQQVEKEKELLELDHNISQQKIMFQQSIQTLQSRVIDWIRSYVIMAPIDGKLTLLSPTQENQFLKNGKVLGFITPKNSKYYMIMNIQQFNFGKIEKNQNVQLRFDAYPYQEWGVVNCKIEFISNFATDSGFYARLKFVDENNTNFNKKIIFRDGLTADANIITKNKNLLQRLFYKYTALFDR